MALYTTYFDSNYLLRGATCIRSIAERAKTPVRFLVLALDEACAVNLPKLLPDLSDLIDILTLEDVEKANLELLEAKGNRSKVEYIFTLTPILCKTATERVQPGEIAVYFDADMYFFADGALALAEMGTHDVAITEHRFPADKTHLAAPHGRFNVGWLAFRHSENAFQCLNRWRAQCLDFCGLEPSDKGFGDQKYLDDWPETVKNLVIVDHPGVNTAPWNAMNHSYSGPADAPLVDSKPIIVFHFHRLKKLDNGIYETIYDGYGTIPPTVLPAYGHYLRALEATEQQAQTQGIPTERIAARSSPFAHGWLARTRLAFRQSWTGERMVFKEGHPLPTLRSLAHVG